MDQLNTHLGIWFGGPEFSQDSIWLLASVRGEMQCHSNEYHCKVDTQRWIQLDDLQWSGKEEKTLNIVFHLDELFSLKLCSFNSVLWIGPCLKREIIFHKDRDFCRKTRRYKYSKLCSMKNAVLVHKLAISQYHYWKWEFSQTFFSIVFIVLFVVEVLSFYQSKIHL